MGGHTRRRTFLTGVMLLPLAGCATGPTGPSAGELVAGQLADLERRAGARLGVYAISPISGKEVKYRADELFPMCSTFKGLVAGAVLDKVPTQRLSERVTFRKRDLVHGSPITEKAVDTGLTVRELCDAAIRYSDNTAANLLLDEIGGEAALVAFLRSLGDEVTRLDRREPELNEAVPGDERDTTSPRAIANDYRELVLGKRLSADTKFELSQWLVGNTTGDARIRAGMPAGWKIGDKTGTGGYGTANDIAVAWPPSRPAVVIGIMTTKPAADAAPDEALIVEATKIIAAQLSTPDAFVPLPTQINSGG